MEMRGDLDVSGEALGVSETGNKGAALLSVERAIELLGWEGLSEAPETFGLLFPVKVFGNLAAWDRMNFRRRRGTPWIYPA